MPRPRSKKKAKKSTSKRKKEASSDTPKFEKITEVYTIDIGRSGFIEVSGERRTSKEDGNTRKVEYLKIQPGFYASRNTGNIKKGDKLYKRGGATINLQHEDSLEFVNDLIDAIYDVRDEYFGIEEDEEDEEDEDLE